jgi:hypothetical protein
MNPACQTTGKPGMAQLKPARISKVEWSMSRPVLRTGGVTPLSCTSTEKRSVKRYSPVRGDMSEASQPICGFPPRGGVHPSSEDEIPDHGGDLQIEASRPSDAVSHGNPG